MSDICPQLKILMVDDHPLTLTMLSKILNKIGFTNLKEATNGDLALTILGEEDIGLLFTDLNMPDLSGVDLIRQIRQQDATKDLPVIVISAESDRQVVLRALQAGADAFVVKPFSGQIIKEKIIQVLSKRARSVS